MAAIQEALHRREALEHNQDGPYSSAAASRQHQSNTFHSRHHDLGPGHPFMAEYPGRPHPLPRPPQHHLSAEPYDSYDTHGQHCPASRLYTSSGQSNRLPPPAQAHRYHPQHQQYRQHNDSHPHHHHQYATLPHSSRDQPSGMAPFAEHVSSTPIKHERHASRSEHSVLRNSEGALHIEANQTATEQLLSQGGKTQHQETPCPAESASRQHHATIKIVQQPLHARMCGFGEKDRRPIDPPPIVQLILDDPHYNELKAPPQPVVPIKSRRGRKKKNIQKPKHPHMNDHHPANCGSSTSSTPAKTAFKGHDHHRHHAEDNDDDHHGEDVDELDEDNEIDHHDGSEEDQLAGTPSSPHLMTRPRGRSDSSSVDQASSTEHVGKASTRKHGREDTHTSSGPDKFVEHQEPQPSEVNELKAEDQGEPQEWPRYIGGASALRQDPLFVLHVSLWSEDGSDVRSMIATSGRSDPAKLTRILMGAAVVSPILLNNERGEPGWYFSFPDLSVRTEGVYTLKFSLMRFASFDFSEQGGSHASLVIAETTSQPFTVFSAKKFPGMTESTELSKAFARQGLKIPIRNDLRARKNADKDE